MTGRDTGHIHAAHDRCLVMAVFYHAPKVIAGNARHGISAVDGAGDREVRYFSAVNTEQSRSGLLCIDVQIFDRVVGSVKAAQKDVKIAKGADGFRRASSDRRPELMVEVDIGGQNAFNKWVTLDGGGKSGQFFRRSYLINTLGRHGRQPRGFSIPAAGRGRGPFRLGGG